MADGGHEWREDIQPYQRHCGSRGVKGCVLAKASALDGLAGKEGVRWTTAERSRPPSAASDTAEFGSHNRDTRLYDIILVCE